MAFHRSKMKINIKQSVLIDKEEITRVKFIKFLGVIDDENISWVNHIEYI